MARPTYRQIVGTDTWHFCKNCRHWPSQHYAWTWTMPAVHELCEECVAKEQAGDCA